MDFAPEVDSPSWPARSTIAVACSLLVLLVLTHLVLCSLDCQQSAPPVFSALSTFEILRELIFWSIRALTGVSVRGLGFGADAGSSLSGVGPPVVHN